MFYDDHKKDGGGLRPAKMAEGGDVKDEYGDDHDDVLKMVAEELISAIHSKDTGGCVEALRSFLACVRQIDEEQDEDDQG